MKLNSSCIGRKFFALAITAAVSCVSSPQLQAAPIYVTGPWTTATGQGNGPITNQNTASPTVGDGTANSADGEMFDSPFPAITLSDPGDKIIFQGQMRLTGSVNSAASSGTPRTQFRFGLFGGDEVGLDDNGWVGYFTHNKHGNAGTPAGVLARKPVGNTSAYLSTTGASTAMASVQGDGTAASLFHDDLYTLKMTIERNALGELLVSASIMGDNGFSQTLTGTDTTASTLGTYTFDHVGFLLGGNLDTDQAQFINLLIAIPEPASWLLGVSSLVATVLFGRRRKQYCYSVVRR
jgi:hypothetical protein